MSTETTHGLRLGYREGLREIGRRAAENGLPIGHIDRPSAYPFGDSDKALWREGWRERRRTALGLKVVRT